MMDCEDDEEDEFEIEEPNGSVFADEHGESTSCIVQRFLCNQKASGTTQQYQIFYLRCSVKCKVCNSSLTMEVARILSLKHLWAISS